MLRTLRLGCKRHQLIAAGGLLCICAIAISLFAQGKPGASTAASTGSTRAEAKTIFETVCASCHGLDGRGGERGPDISSRPEIVRKTDAELLAVLKSGKSASGMPSFAAYGSPKLVALVKFVRELQGRSVEVRLPGSPDRGKDLFFGKAGCSNCHMVGGKGGFLGQDLTTYAARRNTAEIRAAIVNPNKDLDPRRGLVTVVLPDSTRLSGLARNEDNFSLQLQTIDGAFHLLNKSDISTLIYEKISPMPADYGTKLSPAELDDVLSFLLRNAGPPFAKKPPIEDEEEDE